MARKLWLPLLLAAVISFGQEQKQQPSSHLPQVEKQNSPPDEQNPPEEDEAEKPKQYSFNPIQAAQELKVGEFYFNKGNHSAAALRFEEATKWNPTSIEAFLKLGEVREKMKNKQAARQAYQKVIDIDPESKEAKTARKKLTSKSLAR